MKQSKRVRCDVAYPILFLVVLVVGGVLWWRMSALQGIKCPTVPVAVPIERPVGDLDTQEGEAEMEHNEEENLGWKMYKHEKTGVMIGAPEGYMPYVDTESEQRQVFSVRSVEVIDNAPDECSGAECPLQVSITNVDILGKKAKNLEEFSEMMAELGEEITADMIDNVPAYRFDEGNAYVAFFEGSRGMERYDFVLGERATGEEFMQSFRFQEE